jgi:hypothetical protein
MLYRGLKRCTFRRSSPDEVRELPVDHEPPIDQVTPTRRRMAVLSSLDAPGQVQRGTDPLTGGRRDDVLIGSEDMERLRLHEGAALRLESPNGAFEGRLRCAPIRSGNLEVH